MGSLPILTVGDVVLCESFQITRFLGEEYQLSGIYLCTMPNPVIKSIFHQKLKFR